MSADLHCHTIKSDGSVGAEELILLAAKQGLTAVAITDHDTFAGVETARICGEKYGVRVIPGVELSCKDPINGRKVHILCYLSKKPKALKSVCSSILSARNKAAASMIKKVQNLYPLPEKLILHHAEGSECIYKQHIMHALMDAGYSDSIFGDVFQRLFHPRTGLAWEPVSYPDVHEMIRLVHQAGGVAVLAHPGEYDSYQLLDQLAADHEIDGVEVRHSRNRPGDEEKFTAIAKRSGLLMTGGSDFHGMYTKHPRRIGFCTAGNEQLEKLLRFADRL